MVKERKTGFTVVELLIVIVVIGILAAISIVSYRNMTDRANDSIFLANMNSFAKEMSLHRMQNKTYPKTISDIYGISEKVINKNAFAVEPDVSANLYICYGNGSDFVLRAQSVTGMKYEVSAKNLSPNKLPSSETLVCQTDSKINYNSTPLYYKTPTYSKGWKF